MSWKTRMLGLLWAVCAIAMTPLSPACRGANTPASATPPEGVKYAHELRQVDGKTLSLHVVTVDLTNPGVSLRVVPGGGTETTAGKWQTTLLSVPKIAEREHFDVAINGDYFDADLTVDADSAEGLAALASGKYRTGQRARVMGTAVTDGRQWATPAGPVPVLLVTPGGKVSMGEMAKVPAGEYSQAISGNYFVVAKGKVPGHRGTERHARTAVGLDEGGKTLTILVVDGLVDGRASGMTTPELCREMVRLGCYDAIGLDGGGSSTLVMREAGAEGGPDRYRVMNRPTDGKPRPVAEALGVVVKGVERSSGK